MDRHRLPLFSTCRVCFHTHTHTHSFGAFHGEQVENTPRGNWRNTKTTTMTTTSSTAISEYYYGMGFFFNSMKKDTCVAWCVTCPGPQHSFCIGNREAEKNSPPPVAYSRALEHLGCLGTFVCSQPGKFLVLVGTRTVVRWGCDVTKCTP